MTDAGDSRYEDGLRVRTEVLGSDHVARAQSRQTPLDADFQRFITEMAWGSVWTRPDLDRRTRSLVTLGILAALGRHEELRLHIRASQNIGVDPQEIAEAFLHVAVYAGVPAANSAFALAKATLAELTADEAGAGADEARVGTGEAGAGAAEAGAGADAAGRGADAPGSA